MSSLAEPAPARPTGRRDGKIKPPSELLTYTEFPRAMWEFLWLLVSWRYLERLPAGDGHPVLVLPGFASGDAWTLLLRRFIRHLGYDVYRWDLGQNTGRRSVRQGLYRRVNEIVGRTQEPFTVIGHSLGGMYARELAHTFPSHIRQVISLGSPASAHDGEGINDMVHRFYMRTSAGNLPGQELPGRHDRRSSRVPCTSIYSRGDGVAAWQLCIEEESPFSESIETWGSHSGMTFNPLVFYIVADRLAQPAGEWSKFDVTSVSPAALQMTLAPVHAMLQTGFRNPWQSGL